MLNRYPLWKYILVLIIVIAALLYALPNLYGEDPAVQITGARGEQATVSTEEVIQKTLQENHISTKSIVFDQGSVLVRLHDTDTQLHAKDLLVNALGDKYVVALNLAPSTPRWLTAFGAEPMKLGLDLRGGVHFLMEVDMATALEKLQQQSIDNFSSELRSKRIAFHSIVAAKNNGITLTFKDKDATEAAYDYLRPRYPDRSFQIIGNNMLIATLTEASISQARTAAVDQNINILRSRVNQLGVAEPLVQRQGADRIVIELPGIQDTARAKEILGATATLEFRLVNTSVNAQSVLSGQSILPMDSEIKYMRDGQPVVLYKRVILRGDHIIDSSSRRDEQFGQPVVDISLDSQGGSIMSSFTRLNVKKPMATLFVEYKESGRKDAQGKAILEKHEEVINVATIQTQLGSRFQITGIGNPVEARQLSLLLRAGALIAPIQIVEERTIGPTMGQQNINQGFESCAWGLAISIIFMLVVYRLFGIFASVALFINLVLIVGIMSLLPGATLTMPGIAGIVLTLGVAIDANVLINERIKEELRNGRSVQQAIHEGYAGAWNSIFDANITTLITAIILYAVGTGSVKGFAVTLAIGVITSMFTSIIGTRALVNLIYGGRRVKKLSI